MKRSRKPEWSCTFYDSAALRGIVEAVQAIVQRVVFKIARPEGSDRFMLMFDGADPGMSCWVSARLNIDQVEFAGEPDEFTFCVCCKQLMVSIDNSTCSHGLLTLEGHSDGTVLVIAQDPDQRASLDLSRINTFVETKEEDELKDMKLDLTLEMDVGKLKELIKKARKSHAETLRVEVYLKKEGNLEVSKVIFSVDGDAYHAQSFCHEVTRGDDGSISVRAAVEGGGHEWDELDVAPTLKASYPIGMIDAFVKILPVRILKAQAQTGMPLVMTHELNGGILNACGTACNTRSHIRFVVAPLNDED
jgi:hypothetical protein